VHSFRGGLPGVPGGWLGTVGDDGALTFEQKDPLPFAGAQAGVVVPALRWDMARSGAPLGGVRAGK